MSTLRSQSAAIFRDHQRCVERARQLLTASRRNSGSIAAEVAAARLVVAGSRAVLERSTVANPCGYLAPADQEVTVAQAASPAAPKAETARRFAAITTLVAEIEQAATRAREPIDDLVRQIKLVLASDPDPSLVVGVLVEGIAQAVRQLVPEVEQLDMLIAAMAMLRDRTLLPDDPGG